LRALPRGTLRRPQSPVRAFQRRTVVDDESKEQ